MTRAALGNPAGSTRIRSGCRGLRREREILGTNLTSREHWVRIVANNKRFGVKMAAIGAGNDVVLCSE